MSNIKGSASSLALPSIILGIIGLWSARLALATNDVSITPNPGWPTYDLERGDGAENGGSAAYGSSVAVSGSRAIVSDPGIGVGDYQGSAFFFERQSAYWRQIGLNPQKYGGTIGRIGTVQYPCSAVAIDGNVAAIGEAENTVLETEPHQGAVSVFEYDGNSWAYKTTLIDPDGRAYDSFGCSIAISGAEIVVGAPGANGGSGAAVVFNRSSDHWFWSTRLTPKGTPPQAFAGTSVAAIQGKIIVGAPFENNAAGAAYLYENQGSSWIERRITADDGVGGDTFGGSVAIASGTVVVSAPGKNASTGGVYIFAVSDTSIEIEQKFILTPSSLYDILGYSVAMDESKILIGRPGLNRAHLLAKRDGRWQPRLTFFGEHSYFGAAVSLSGDSVIIGAPGDGGRSYIFRDDEIFSSNFQ